MIQSDLRNHKGLHIQGSIRDVSAECVLIMREIYKRNKQVYSEEVAIGILTNMLIKAIDDKADSDIPHWTQSEEEKLAYTD